MYGRKTKEQLEFIKHNEQRVKILLSKLEMARQFKLGDYLVVYGVDAATGKSKIITNSYGVPVKFKVELVDNNGIAYVRKVINMKQMSRDFFPLFDFTESDFMEYYTRGIDASTFEWKLDEEYVEATIMGEEDNYVSAIEHHNKSRAHKEISEYNASIRKRMNSVQVAQRFINDLKIGITIWKSANNWYSVTNKLLKGTNGPCAILVVTDSKNKTKKLRAQDLVHKVFYTSRPRSYKELHDPNI